MPRKHPVPRLKELERPGVLGTSASTQAGAGHHRQRVMGSEEDQACQTVSAAAGLRGERGIPSSHCLANC